MAGEVIPLGARLRQRREELGLSQTQAARELDVARTAYRLWEMEAARPAPDRWRVIANWLGISITALLLAGELLDAQEAVETERAAFDAGLTSEGWDERSGAVDGDYFAQERAMIAEQSFAGNISLPDATTSQRLLQRIQDATERAPTYGWHPSRFVKRLPSTALAPALARAALSATAAEIPREQLDDAALLTSELVTNSVTHAASDWIGLDITLRTDRLRVEVSDQGQEPIRPRSQDGHCGLGLAVIGQLATRWGVARDDTGKKIWVEFDLAEPARRRR